METRRDVFQAIADPTRREIIRLVAKKTMNLNAIAENFDTSRQSISVHIKILAECGLIIMKNQGRERYCEASLKPLKQVAEWVEEYRKLWEGRFAAIDGLLNELQAGSKKNKRKNKH